MRYIYLITLFFVLLFYGCSNKMTEEQTLVTRYLKEQQKIELSSLDSCFVVVISGNCGSCTEQTISFLRKLGNNKDRYFKHAKIVILPENNAYAIDSIGVSSIKFIVDDGYNLSKYGVNFPKNIILEFKQNSLVFQNWLYLNKIDSIGIKYGLL